MSSSPEARAAWRKKNPEKVKEYARRQRERTRADPEAWERRKQYAREWYRGRVASSEEARAEYNERTRQYQEANRDVVRARQKRYHDRKLQTRLETRFGMIFPPNVTAEEMLKRQNGNCALCGEPILDARHRNFDHCHKTGYVRGVIHNTCNTGLGGFHDDPEMLRKALVYLERSEAEILQWPKTDYVHVRGNRSKKGTRGARRKS